MSGVIAGAVIGGIMGFSSGGLNVRKANKKVIKAFNKSLAVMNRNYSYAQNELDKQAVYERDGAISEMYQLSLNGLRNNSLVEATIGESGLEGRSQRAVARDVRGQSERQKDNIQSSYENAIYSIKSQKDSLHVEYSQDVQNLHDQYQAQITKGWNAFWKIADSTAQGAAMGYFAGGIGGSFMSGALGGASGTGLTAGATSGGFGMSSSALSSLGVGASASTGGLGVSALSNTGLASSAAGSSFSWAGGWANVMNNWGTYYNNVNKYMNYYKTFRTFVGQNNRRGTYY